MLLLRWLPHEVQLLLTYCAHACKAFVGNHQLAVAIPQLALCGECVLQHMLFTILICGVANVLNQLCMCRPS